VTFVFVAALVIGLLKAPVESAASLKE